MQLAPRHLAAAALAFFFAVAQVPTAPGYVYRDTFQYALIAGRDMGESAPDARSRAIALYCQGQASDERRTEKLDPVSVLGPDPWTNVYRDCVRTVTENGFPEDSARYRAIFEARPGYPWLASLLARLFGLVWGMWLVSLFATLAAGLIVFAILRRMGATGALAWFGQLLYYLLPTGSWSVRLLADGLTLSVVTVVLLGAVLLVQGHWRFGVLIILAGYGAGFGVKYSQFALLGVSLALAALCWLLLRPRSRGRALLVLGLSAGCALSMLVAASALGWPGVQDSLQDLFTRHYLLPPVTDSWQRLARLNWNYWVDLISGQLAAPLGILTIGVGVWALFRRVPDFAWVVIGVAGAGLANEMVHPLATQGDRLYVLVWFAAICGLPFAPGLLNGFLKATVAAQPNSAQSR